MISNVKIKISKKSYHFARLVFHLEQIKSFYKNSS